jgi:hypothetical protein
MRAKAVASVASLTFTSANWNVAQSVTVTGVDDPVRTATSRTASRWRAHQCRPELCRDRPDDVALVNADNDAAGIAVTPVAGLLTSEAGAAASFTRGPQEPADGGCRHPGRLERSLEGNVSSSSLTFTAADWNVPRPSP